jgi:hypothetical protein
MMRRLRYLALAVLIAQPVTAQAQQLRGSLTSIGRYVQIHPIARDTVDSAATTIDENGRRTFEGRPVFCSAQTCTFYRPAEIEHALAMTQDLALTSWGFGVEGLSATVFLRARQELGGDFTWPRSDDPFDAVLAYAELARERYRLRLGRQRSLSGLGFYAFDGLSANFSATSWLNVEAYGGRSLARALEEPRREALDAIESFIPDNEAWLVGAAAEFEAGLGNAATIRYQREIWSDRAALISERASVDVRANVNRVVQMDASADYDVAYNRLGKAHITLRRHFLDQRLSVAATGRRYLPFFELWTIWGVFSPVAYHEAELEAGYQLTQRLQLWASAGFRSYQDSEAAVFIAPAKDQTHRFVVRARNEFTERVNVNAEYRLESGFGAYLSSGEAAVSWDIGERLNAGIYATAFQQILEFRTGEAAVFGAGGTFDYEMSPAFTISGGATLYRQAFDNRPSAVDWSQKRAWLGVEWQFGRDPGLAMR